MRPVSTSDIARALSHCDPQQLAHSLAAAGAESITRVTDALEAATDLLTAFPRDGVTAEADTLLYDVLRWPVSDAVAGWERLITPASYATHQGLELDEARLALGRLRASEADGARAFLAAGAITNYTLEQSQVVECIELLMSQGIAPTRDLVRKTAFDTARSVMRRGDGDNPIVYSIDEDLPPRIVSPSPKVHAVLWLTRMESAPPAPGNLHDRIDYLKQAALAIGSGSRAHARVVELRERQTRLPDHPTLNNVAESGASMGMVS